MLSRTALLFALTLAVGATTFALATTQNGKSQVGKGNATPPANVEKKKDPIAAIDKFISAQKESGKIDMSSEGWRTSLPKFPEVEFPEGTDYFWELKTNKGPMKLRFWTETAPNHAANFIYLTRLGFYDGLTFHRVITNFMAQGGCPNGDGRGNPGYRYKGEFEYDTRHDRAGLLSMANSGPGTDGSQFFITFKDTPHLDGNHTLFGELVDGMDTLKKLEEAGSAAGTPTESLIIEDASISTAKAPKREKPKTQTESAAEFLTSQGHDVKKAYQTESGLWIIDLEEGEGASPQPTSTVECHYTGWLVNGKKFDSSRDRGEPTQFPLNRVIKGWTEGVSGMKVGGRRILVIPYELAYGEAGRRGAIPGHAMLIFDIELVSIPKP